MKSSGAEEPAVQNRRRWWIFDVPVWSDWLFWIALVGGVASALFVLRGERWYRTSATPALTLTLAFAVQFLVGVLIVGVVGSILREYVRGRRQGPPEPDADSGPDSDPG